MNTFLFKFEAIESRIASYSCPRGIPGRVHALRLRRCFRNNGRRQSTALGEQFPIHERDGRIEPGLERSADIKDTVEEPGTIEKAGGKDGDEAEQIQRQLARRGLPASISRMRVERTFRRTRMPQVHGDMVRPPRSDDGIHVSAEDEAALYSALKTGDPHVVFKALSGHAKLVGFHNTNRLLISTPPATFSEILRCLDPKYFVGRYKQLHQEISPAVAKLLGLSEAFDQSGYYKFCTLFLADIQSILEARHWQHPATLSDYKSLLRCARATGHTGVAEYIWTSMTAKKKNYSFSPKLPTPDAECYNSYLSIKSWHDSTNPLLRFRMRVIPDNYGPRSWGAPPYSLKGHAVGGSLSLKAQVSTLFRHMVEAGISGNEETFCLMMVSMAREGDMAGVASILQRVWNIDVQRLTTSNESEIPLAKRYPGDSPFHPSSMLLYTIAHTYGINNQLPTALRLVDYVSAQYSVPIPVNVWNELLQWTFVLSIQPKDMKRRGEVLHAGKEIGQLPPESVSNLWQTMVSEPYNVKPTLEMYNRLIINLYHRQRYGEMQSRMEEARLLLRKDIRSLSHKQAVFNATTRRRSPTHLAERRMRDLVFARLRVRRNRKYFERWVKLMLHHGSNSLKYNDDWTAKNVPNIIKNWFFFVPRKVRYSIRSGVVRFYSGTNTKRNSRYVMKIGRSHKLERRRLRIRKGMIFSRRYGGTFRRLSAVDEEERN
jgi:hypothetical protein